MFHRWVFLAGGTNLKGSSVGLVTRPSITALSPLSENWLPYPLEDPASPLLDQGVP